jgi:hypothetical protein
VTEPPEPPEDSGQDPEEEAEEEPASQDVTDDGEVVASPVPGAEQAVAASGSVVSGPVPTAIPAGDGGCADGCVKGREMRDRRGSWRSTRGVPRPCSTQKN